MERSKQLGEEKILKLLMKFSLPAIVGMLVNALYNMVDRAFIGNWIGDVGIAGITVGFPVMLVTMAFAMLVGIGATSLFSIRLGEQKREEAEQILGNALSLSIVVSIVITILGLLSMNPLLRLMGASETVLPYAKDYLQIILWGNTFMAIGFGMNNFIRAEGNPMTAMATMFIGAILNIILDPIFIYVFGWGMRGAALATILSQGVSMIWVLSYFLRGKSSVKFHLYNLKLKLPIVGKIVALGIAPFAMQIAASFVNGIMNSSLSHYGSDIALAGVGVVNSIMTLMIMPIFGINQGAQPIIGYNYGAHQYKRVKEALKIAIIAATTISVFGFFMIMVFSSGLISLFGKDNVELITFGSRAIRIVGIFLPLIGFQIVGANYFQVIGKPLHSSILNLSRQVILLIPAILILPLFFDLNGVLYAIPVADIGSTILTATLLFMELRKLNAKQQEQDLKPVALELQPD